MPITHRIESDSSIVYVDVTGSPSTAEMCEAIDRVVADPDFQAGFGLLSDHRRLDVPATTDQVHAILGRLTEHKSAFGTIRWAIVVDRTASFGMMRMLSVLAEEVPARVEVFRSVDEAKSWLLKKAGAEDAEP